MCTKYLMTTLAILSVVGAGSASFFDKCDDGDVKCIKKMVKIAIPTFAVGIPELGVKPLDPYVFKKIDASTSSLNLILKDVTIKGLKNCDVKEIERDVAAHTLSIKLLCDATVDGDYEMKGNVLVLSLEGQGKIHIKLNQLLINAQLSLVDKTGDDGKVHWGIKEWKHTYELQTKAFLKFENLFPGNELLRRAARELFDSSPNVVIYELAPPIIKKMASKVIEQVSNLFKKIPKEELVN